MEEVRYSGDSHIPLKACYTPEDMESSEYNQKLDGPGQFPFTRGIYATGYRNSTWAQRNLAGFDLSEDTNKRLKQQIKDGQQAFGGKPTINIVFDLPTQVGLDSDHLLAKHEVGKTGAAVPTAGEIARLLEGIPLEECNVGFANNALAPISTAMYIWVAENQGIPMAKLRGQNANTPLAFLNGAQMIFPPDCHFRMMMDLVYFCAKNMPLFGNLNLAGYPITEGGGTAVQEVAFQLAYAIDVTEAGLRLGLDIDEFVPRISAFVGLGMNFFENIAKVRALRRMYARIMKERFGAQNPKVQALKVMTWTAGSTATSQQPLNNISRAAIEALSGVLAGVQMINITAYDEALSIPDEEAAHIAVMTHKILEHETGLCDVVDPLGGSYFVESLTDQIEKASWEQLEEVERRGGWLACVKNEYLEIEVLKERLRKQHEMEEGKRIIVGVNRYVMEEEVPTPTLKHRPDVRDIMVARLREWRRDRDEVRLKESLERVTQAALDSDEYLMPHFLDAVRARATLGEITQALYNAWGHYRHPASLAK